MRLSSWVALLLLLIASPGFTADAPDQDREKPHAGPDDSFLQNLVGDWMISRSIRDTVVSNTLKAEWVLDHQFVQLHMRDAADPPRYEALVLVGFDAHARTYVAYWCDSYGAQYAGVGVGKRSGNTVDFVFHYPDGPFHNTFTWNPATSGWTFLMEAENPDGSRRFFAKDTVRRH